jgi:2-polyprenyl-6-methoxyphenol hydroxylase-like FAD-dependent oxidoreductase
MKVIDRNGRQIARLPMQSEPGAFEIPRADLAAVLSEAAEQHAEFRFDDTITALHADTNGVDVDFDRAAAERFDLVIGADGLHSTVRRLAWGPESEFVSHLGVYVATLPLGEPAEDPDHAVLYNEPGRLASIHPSRGDALAAFIFRAAAIPGLDHRDTVQHRRIVTAAYTDAGWQVPHLMQKLQTQDLYFDSVSRVHLPTWTHGRITLAGDAASCVSLFGDGSSLAMTGAHTLANALRHATSATPASLTEALRRYELEHRTLTDPKIRNAARAAALVVPKTRLGLAARNVTARVLAHR